MFETMRSKTGARHWVHPRLAQIEAQERAEPSRGSSGGGLALELEALAGELLHSAERSERAREEELGEPFKSIRAGIKRGEQLQRALAAADARAEAREQRQRDARSFTALMEAQGLRQCGVDADGRPIFRQPAGG